ncbi:hypothetical protein PHYBOEH_005356 [Phytophthora boehmeriae]|uniref:Uncharacterized protein n=1 Tax=Phytophthora boehmeriae TaxID=109152 RepID=A0A8T1X465_9STRA|nr:hypothetical protein PHYBOEH_005356 [Phytophthora boehmeriae]
MASSYDASDVSVDMDSALMGACLMNLHSVLDSNFLPFGQRLTQVETEDEPGGDRLVRATRLLKALGFPLADVQQLVQYSQSELESDPLLWNDWSFQGWTKRAANCQVQKTAEKAPRPRSILVTKPDEAEFVLEQDDNKSPQDVDWLTS